MRKVTVSETYQQGYIYEVTEPQGKNFDPNFKPELTPRQMLKMGIFGGNYFTVPPKEFPREWFEGVELSGSGKAEARLNYFQVNASQPLITWQRKGWIYFEDPKGWFLWYCRYYLGRRIPEEDARQIKRWNMMSRHISQIMNNCVMGDVACRPKQRQALLHWAYDSRKI